MVGLKTDWQGLLEPEFEKTYYQQLKQELATAYETETIYPDAQDIYTALQLTSYEETKVVILGQDPYHGADQAHGLSFSVKPGVRVPPSLRNMYKELHNDLGCTIPNHGYLVEWAKQGVLLLNAVLTVRAATPNAHKALGWEHLTNRVIQLLDERQAPVVFMLWGRFAQEKEKFITADRHLVLTSPHPSPFSAHRGFFGSHPFSQANTFLKTQGLGEIDWQISDR